MKTVGVAPGTYTLQLGAPMMMTPAPNSWQMDLPQAPCPPDGWGTGAYGVPRVGWYDLPGIPMTAGSAPIGPVQDHPMNPYGTESQLKGIFDSWWWTNRKWIVVGAIGIFGLAIVGAASAILK